MVVLWRQKPQDKTHHSTTLQTLPSAGLFDPQDPEEEEEILFFAIILILVIPGGWKWAGDVLGEKLGNLSSDFGTLKLWSFKVLRFQI